MGDTLLEKQMEIQREILDANDADEEEKEQPDKKRIKVSDKQLYVLKSDTLEVADDEGSD